MKVAPNANVHIDMNAIILPSILRNDIRVHTYVQYAYTLINVDMFIHTYTYMQKKSKAKKYEKSDINQVPTQF